MKKTQKKFFGSNETPTNIFISQQESNSCLSFFLIEEQIAVFEVEPKIVKSLRLTLNTESSAIV